MSKRRVQTSVCFAPTPPFVRAFGKKEAARQQQLFERPSWAKGECTPITHGETRNDLVFASVLGFVAGALCAYLVCGKYN